MALGRMERILILAKTYPSPSAQYVETSCVAGISQDGSMRRLYPVPFRMIEEGQQFKKWQWITARVRRAQDDARPESHRVSVDTIEVDSDPLPTRDHWIARRDAIKTVPVFESFDALEASRQLSGTTLGLVRPSLKLIKTPVTGRANTPLQPLNAVLNEAPERPGLPMPGASNEPTPETLRLADAKRLALENPAAVANIVKGWVNGEAPA